MSHCVLKHKTFVDSVPLSIKGQCQLKALFFILSTIVKTSPSEISVYWWHTLSTTEGQGSFRVNLNYWLCHQDKINVILRKKSSIPNYLRVMKFSTLVISWAAAPSILIPWAVLLLRDHGFESLWHLGLLEVHQLSCPSPVSWFTHPKQEQLC